MKTLVTGATGFVGRRLLTRLSQPVILTRNPEKAKQRLGAGIEVHGWDPMSEPAPPAAFEGVETVIHLAGEPIADGRWTADKKRRLKESRVRGTENLVDSIAALGTPPKVLVSASAIGFYGIQGEQILDEDSPPGDDFLAEICTEWEFQAARAAELDLRVAMARVGIVLGPDGGALEKMLTPFKLGVGGPLGNGKQWMSWIHIDDLVDMLLFAAENEHIRGPFNAVGPEPVRNKEFTKALGSVLHRPTLLPAPGFALKLAFGEFADFLLGSQRVVPHVLPRHGYKFHFRDVHSALEAAVAGDVPLEKLHHSREAGVA